MDSYHHVQYQTTDPLLRKLSDGWTYEQIDRQTDRQTDRQMDKSDFIARCLTNVERPKAKMVAYKVKCKAERKRFGNTVQREDQK